MEVHPPEHPIQTPRDFFLHIFTITIGLLIALSLEAMVELAHHRHLLHTANENLRSEIQANRALLAGDRRFLDSTEAQLQQDLATLNAARAGHPGGQTSRLHWEWDGPQAPAWDTAHDNGALALMPYEQAVSYAVVYSQQKVVNDQAALYVRDIYTVNTPLLNPGTLSGASPEALNSTIANAEHTLADLHLLRDYCDSLDRIYTRANNF